VQQCSLASRLNGRWRDCHVVSSKYSAEPHDCPVLSFDVLWCAVVCCGAQAIPGLSPVPWWGTLFPLAVVLLVNGIKEAFDDYWRHKSDEQVGAREGRIRTQLTARGLWVVLVCGWMGCCWLCGGYMAASLRASVQVPTTPYYSATPYYFIECIIACDYVVPELLCVCLSVPLQSSKRRAPS
jgi:hypothetical protein